MDTLLTRRELNVSLTAIVHAVEQPTVVDLRCCLDVLLGIAEALEDRTEGSHPPTNLLLRQARNLIPIIIVGQALKGEHLKAVLEENMDTSSTWLVVGANTNLNKRDCVVPSVRGRRSE